MVAGGLRHKLIIQPLIPSYKPSISHTAHSHTNHQGGFRASLWSVEEGITKSWPWARHKHLSTMMRSDGQQRKRTHASPRNRRGRVSTEQQSRVRACVRMCASVALYRLSDLYRLAGSHEHARAHTHTHTRTRTRHPRTPSHAHGRTCPSPTHVTSPRTVDAGAVLPFGGSHDDHDLRSLCRCMVGGGQGGGEGCKNGGKNH